MDPQIQMLLDKQEIAEVQARYCRTLDWLDEEGLSTVFWPDAHIDYGFFIGNGEDFIPAVMQIERRSERRWHNLNNLSVKVSGNDAESECYGIAQSTSTRRGEQHDQIFGGRYLDALQKRDGTWRISRRKFVLDWTQSFANGLSPFRDGAMAMPILDITESGHPEYRKL